VEWLLGWVSTIPIAAKRHEIANRTITNLLNRIEIRRLVKALQADAHFKILCLCFLSSGQHAANAGWIGRYRFLHEHVLASANGSLEMLGAIARRAGQQNNVHTAFQNLTVAVEAKELPLLTNIDFARGVCDRFR